MEELYTLERIGNLVCDANESHVEDPFPSYSVEIVVDYTLRPGEWYLAYLNPMPKKYHKIIYNPEFEPPVLDSHDCSCIKKR